jgi:hypothetical protein
MLDAGPLGMVTNPKTSSAICQREFDEAKTL